MGEILIGDSLERLRTLPDRSVQTIITSPPYFCLRKYCEDEREIGLEAKTVPLVFFAGEGGKKREKGVV